jgi:hypothetical protein
MVSPWFFIKDEKLRKELEVATFQTVGNFVLLGFIAALWFGWGK